MRMETRKVGWAYQGELGSSGAASGLWHQLGSQAEVQHPRRGMPLPSVAQSLAPPVPRRRDDPRVLGAAGQQARGTRRLACRGRTGAAVRCVLALLQIPLIHASPVPNLDLPCTGIACPAPARAARGSLTCASPPAAPPARCVGRGGVQQASARRACVPAAGTWAPPQGMPVFHPVCAAKSRKLKAHLARVSACPGGAQDESGVTVELCESVTVTAPEPPYQGCFPSYTTVFSAAAFFFREKAASPSLAGRDCAASTVTEVRLLDHTTPAAMAGRVEVKIGGWWGTGEPARLERPGRDWGALRLACWLQGGAGVAASLPCKVCKVCRVSTRLSRDCCPWASPHFPAQSAPMASPTSTLRRCAGTWARRAAGRTPASPTTAATPAWGSR